VLVATRNPLNLGAAARAMSNFGFPRLRVVNPFEMAFREARSAVGAEAVLAAAEEYPTLAEAISDCSLVVGTTAATRRDLRQPLRRLDDGARKIRRLLSSTRVALLFGSEKRGLSNQDLNFCHWVMRIPTRAEHASMNLGQAVAVCLYELARLENDDGASPNPALAATEKLEQITSFLFVALQISGYVKARTAGSAEDKLRRLVRRLQLSEADAETWLGMLRQILWKLNQE